MTKNFTVSLQTSDHLFTNTCTTLGVLPIVIVVPAKPTSMYSHILKIGTAKFSTSQDNPV